MSPAAAHSRDQWLIRATVLSAKIDFGFSTDLRPIQMDETASLPAWRWIASLRSQ
jgi:hypothetical protein